MSIHTVNYDLRKLRRPSHTMYNDLCFSCCKSMVPGNIGTERAAAPLTLTKFTISPMALHRKK